MIYITVNCGEIHSKNEFFSALDGITPPYFGKNLDALHDVLTEMSGVILVKNFGELEKNLPCYAGCIKKVLCDSEEENHSLRVTIE